MNTGKAIQSYAEKRGSANLVAPCRDSRRVPDANEGERGLLVGGASGEDRKQLVTQRDVESDRSHE